MSVREFKGWFQLFLLCLALLLVMVVVKVVILFVASITLAAVAAVPVIVVLTYTWLFWQYFFNVNSIQLDGYEFRRNDLSILTACTAVCATFLFLLARKWTSFFPVGGHVEQQEVQWQRPGYFDFLSDFMILGPVAPTMTLLACILVSVFVALMVHKSRVNRRCLDDLNHEDSPKFRGKFQFTDYRFLLGVLIIWMVAAFCADSLWKLDYLDFLFH
jgi:hypothetical protein